VLLIKALGSYKRQAVGISSCKVPNNERIFHRGFSKIGVFSAIAAARKSVRNA